MSANAPRTKLEIGPSIFATINNLAARTPDAIYLVDPVSREEITFAELKSRVRQVASFIHAQGVHAGESVAYAFSNSIDAATCILGIMYGGYLATSINLVAGQSVISYVLEHSEAKLILANDAGASVVREALVDTGDAPQLIPFESAFAHQGDDVSHDVSHDVSPDAPGLLMYTSGTTGLPKGVVLSHKNLLAGGENTAVGHHLSLQDRALCVLPLYHINGLCVTVMGPLASGGSVVVPPKFSVSTFWQMITNCGCTWFSVVPTQISYLLHDESATPTKEVLSALRFGRSASAPLSPDVQQGFEKRFGVPIIETMGLTETAAQILSNPMPPGIRKIGSPGIAVGNEIRIGDDAQKPCAPDIEGEVLVRGANVMQYYLKNEEATRQAITPDGWLRTGDLGRVDADGYVTITGRLKELIIKGGENIAPREVDDALYTHPDIVEAAAFACTCNRYGETVQAAVMVCEGSALSEAALIALCREKVGAFKTPDRVHFLPELPKGPSGKIQRRLLAEMFA